ncbi:hypothetical protein CTAM01_14172 [Colletotrichum tamarilloi]|uniref:Secreted protein n=1 Tax=Colletotrichum tamarilloi TaxID=1209934 RepID=A0ABQ9QPW9_9PEZI|nr:uncharacterized protein CTAM01_14172 [Colletotrichum tamarilloi]KAK1480887.1 hypothetical protein CTAM01_14172 [Colletotrichum tamarilloi]
MTWNLHGARLQDMHIAAFVFLVPSVMRCSQVAIVKVTSFPAASPLKNHLSDRRLSCSSCHPRLRWAGGALNSLTSGQSRSCLLSKCLSTSHCRPDEGSWRVALSDWTESSEFDRRSNVFISPQTLVGTLHLAAVVFSLHRLHGSGTPGPPNNLWSFSDL